jgi:hypothetical protein
MMTSKTLHGPTNPTALQLWTIRDALVSDADQALGRVKEAGFSAIELAPLPLGLNPDHFAELLARHDLMVVSIHGDLPTAENIGHWVQLTQACRCSKIIWHGWPRDARFDSLEGMRNLIAACNEVHTIACAHGLELLDAVAVGQVTPGPVFTTATFIGYLLGGPTGAAVATVGIFLPAFVFVALTAPILPKLRRSQRVAAFLDGVNVASLALMATVTVILTRTILIDVLTVTVALISGILLLGFRINTTWLILGTALVGLARAGILS